jgi:PKD repeat protein
MIKVLFLCMLTLYVAVAGIPLTAQILSLPARIPSHQPPTFPVATDRIWLEPYNRPLSVAEPCEPAATFTVSKTHIEPGESVTMTSTGPDVLSYQWRIDGEPFVTLPVFTHTFAAPGNYLVELETTTEQCSDTAYAVIHVGSCNGNQTLVWYFGNYTGMRFTTTPPSVLQDGALLTREGCATICDTYGKLLFYTDGVSVWNRVHDTIPGGNATLGGNSSSTQSALIVPVPENPTLYYIFTTDAIADKGERGFGYTLIDMTGDNGKGTVAQAFVPLQDSISEKLTAVRHANGRDIWVIVRGSLNNKLYSFLVTGSGIEEPVINTLGITYQQITETVGAMKVSPTGTTLAIANFERDRVEVYPFNRATGQVSDDDSFILTGSVNCYGIEFSPNGKFLYAGNFAAPLGITQFDLTAGSPAAIQSSAVFLASDDSKSIGSLQLGPDGKIYVSREDALFLGAITQPELPGEACAYTDRAIPLHQPARLGLPGFIQDFVTQERVHIVGPATVCLSSATAHYSSSAPCSGEGCTWLHRGKAAAVLTPDGATLNFSSPGTDTLVLTHRGECLVTTDTLFITTPPAPVVSLGEDIIFCSTASIVLDAGSGFESYLWQDGSAQQQYTVTSPGLYWVTVSDAMGCTATDTLRILDSTAAQFSLGADTSLCSDDVLILRVPEGFRRYTWQDGSTKTTFVVDTAGEYFVAVETLCGTILRDTILVRRTILPMQTSGDTILCSGTSVQLRASGAVSYRWTPTDGLDDPTSPQPIASPATTTTYTVSGTDADGCKSVGTITVQVVDIRQFQLSLPDTNVIPGTQVALPLRARITRENLPFFIEKLTLSVKFRSSIVRVDSVTHGSYTVSPGEYETLHIDLGNLLLTSEDTTLSTIAGTVYLGDAPSTTLELLDISLNGCRLATAGNGSITPDSVCSIDLRRIRYLGDTEISLEVSPNPANETTHIAVTTTEQGEHLLSLYNLQGQLVWQSNFYHSGNRSTHTVAVDSKLLITGLYQVVVTSPTQARTTTLSIVR